MSTLTKQAQRGPRGRAMRPPTRFVGEQTVRQCVHMTTTDRHPSLRMHIRARRTELGDLSQTDLAERAGVVRNTVAKLERGLSLEEGAEAKIERALGWKLGSLNAIRGGGEPTPLTESAAESSRSVDVEAIASMLYAIQSTGEGWLGVRDVLNDLVEVHDRDTMAAIVRRYNELAAGSEAHYA